MLTLCIDTNVWISGVVFSGKPAEVVSAAFARKFHLVLSQAILDELEKNRNLKIVDPDTFLAQLKR